MSSSAVTPVPATPVESKPAPIKLTWKYRTVEKLRNIPDELKRAVQALQVPEFIKEVLSDIQLQQIHESTDSRQIASVLQKCLQKKDDILAELQEPGSRKEAAAFFQKIDRLQDRVCVYEEQADVRQSIQEIFHETVTEAPRAAMSEFLQVVLAKSGQNSEALKAGYEAYAESLPLVQQLLDTDPEHPEQADELRAKFTGQQRKSIEDAVVFAWQNKDLNAYLHGKTLKTRAEDFFATLSFLPKPPTAEDEQQVRACMQARGLGTLELDKNLELRTDRPGLLNVTKEISKLEQELTSPGFLVSLDIELRRALRKLSLKDYLPDGYQRLTETRRVAIASALEISRKTIDREAKRSGLRTVQDIKGEEKRKAVSEKLTRLQFLTDQLRQEVEKMRKMSPELLEHGESIQDLTLFFRSNRYAEFALNQLDRVVGGNNPKFFATDAKYQTREIAETVVGDGSPLKDLKIAIEVGRTIQENTRRLANIFGSCLPGDVSFQHDVFKSIIKGRGKHALVEVYSAFVGEHGHADIVFAQEHLAHFLGLFLGEFGADRELIDAQFLFEGTRDRVDLYEHLTKETKEGLRTKWFPRSTESLDVQQQLVRERVIDEEARLLNDIVLGEPVRRPKANVAPADAARLRKKIPRKETLFSDTRNTVNNSKKNFFIAPIRSMWSRVVYAISSLFRKIFHLAPIPFEDPLKKKEGEGQRLMSCSEFVAATFKSLQHRLEQSLEQQLLYTEIDRKALDQIQSELEDAEEDFNAATKDAEQLQKQSALKKKREEKLELETEIKNRLERKKKHQEIFRDNLIHPATDTSVFHPEALKKHLEKAGAKPIVDSPEMFLLLGKTKEQIRKEAEEKLKQQEQAAKAKKK